MGQVLTPALQSVRSTVLERRRELPVRGDILVEPGAVVSGRDIIARASLPGELKILRVSESLGLQPDEVVQALKVKEGERIEAGQLLCEYRGLFGLLKSRFFSPVTGVLEVVSERTGHLGVRLASIPLELDAFLGGEVASVEEGKSVLIRTRGMFIQGIFGVGGERHGTLRMLSVGNDAVLAAADVPGDAKGTVLVGGCRPSKAFLERAATAGALGLVCGSIDDETLKSYLGYDLGIALTGDEEVPMTLIFTEGFGSIPISERIVSLLSSVEGKEAALNGATQVRAGALRPEIIVCGVEPDGAASAQESLGLAPGVRVRLIRVPFFGRLGSVLELPAQPRVIETGAHCRVVIVALESGEQVVVPRANVELIGT